MDTILQIMCVLGAIWFGLLTAGVRARGSAWAGVGAIVALGLCSAALIVLAWDGYAVRRWPHGQPDGHRRRRAG